MMKISKEEAQEIYPLIPLPTLNAIYSYVNEGQDGGHFLDAVLTNDLLGAFNRADTDNRTALFETLRLLWNFAPADCWGTKEKVKIWCRGRQTTEKRKEKTNEELHRQH